MATAELVKAPVAEVGDYLTDGKILCRVERRDGPRFIVQDASSLAFFKVLGSAVGPSKKWMTVVQWKERGGS